MLVGLGLAAAQSTQHQLAQFAAAANCGGCRCPVGLKCPSWKSAIQALHLASATHQHMIQSCSSAFDWRPQEAGAACAAQALALKCSMPSVPAHSSVPSTNTEDSAQSSSRKRAAAAMIAISPKQAEQAGGYQ